MRAPVTAPQVSPMRAIPPPKAPATLRASSRSSPNSSPKLESTACDHENPPRKQATACSALLISDLPFCFLDTLLLSGYKRLPIVTKNEAPRQKKNAPLPLSRRSDYYRRE